MRKPGKQWMAIFLCVSMLFVTGCGTEQLITMTDEEENTVVNYAAHIVSKYNRSQPDGICRIIKTADAEESTENKEDTQEVSSEADSGTETVNNDMPAQTDTESMTDYTTLNEALGVSNLKIQWTTVQVADYYTESASISLTPDSGKQYLILNMDISNESDQDQVCDILSLKPTFKINIAGDKTVPAQTTILLNDFGTYQGTVPAGEQVSTILIFQVDSNTVTEQDQLILMVNCGGVQSQVELK